MGRVRGRPARHRVRRRSADYLFSIDGNWTDPADNDANIAWVRRTDREAIDLDAAWGTYLDVGGDRDLDRRDRGAGLGAGTSSGGSGPSGTRPRQPVPPERRRPPALWAGDRHRTATYDA
jgi:hypothetical protein